MLNNPKTTDPKDPPSEDRRKDVSDDPSAEFIQEMAEAGSASDLGTINAASDAVEGKENEAVRRKRKEGGQDAEAQDERKDG